MKKIILMASGEGSNFSAIIDNGIKVDRVITDNKNANVIKRAEKVNVPIFVFDYNGNIIDSALLLPGDIYRIEAEQYHSIMPVTDVVIYHENKPGPFLGDDDSIVPEWAPNDVDYDKYIDTLKSYIKEL